ncbi:hypothetical protein AVEN_145221-1 [Araneus ventricosus]|uniref:Uncharacterized protein n=1 Tax=Araneus ventricosus TaxID=182803 RepID=A0A4Y2L6E1_ARAVE|nr:hypothetical protein AVEN_145221-1 [Araneus ventricosus]
MASPQEQGQVVAWFIEYKSGTQVRRKFRTTYSQSPPSRPTIYECHERFMTTEVLVEKEFPQLCPPEAFRNRNPLVVFNTQRWGGRSSNDGCFFFACDVVIG